MGRSLPDAQGWRENLCRSGAAFLTRYDGVIGSHLGIRIPFSNYA
ncbi:MAG TPA: hypothetical protein VHM93_22380 [Candidatus Acidoferrum sp.]|nr:hypothetical protein [Candidatus Acidoferrum sp.]